MATYTAIAASQKDTNSPVDTTLIDRLDQNPHAMFEGASGSPRLQNAAVNTNTVGLNKLAWTSLPAFGTESTQHISTFSNWTVPAGFWSLAIVNSSGTPDTRFEQYSGSTWRAGSAEYAGGLVFSDGTNVRIRTNNGEVDVYRRQVVAT